MSIVHEEPSVEEYWPDRVETSVPAPALRPLTRRELFDSETDLPRVDVLQEHFVRLLLLCTNLCVAM